MEFNVEQFNPDQASKVSGFWETFNAQLTPEEKQGIFIGVNELFRRRTYTILQSTTERVEGLITNPYPHCVIHSNGYGNTSADAVSSAYKGLGRFYNEVTDIGVEHAVHSDQFGEYMATVYVLEDTNDMHNSLMSYLKVV